MEALILAISLQFPLVSLAYLSKSEQMFHLLLIINVYEFAVERSCPRKCTTMLSSYKEIVVCFLNNRYREAGEMFIGH